MAKRNSDPRLVYPEVKLQVRDIVRVAGIVAPFASVGAFTRGKFVLSRPRETMGMPPAAVRHGSARQTSKSGQCWLCRSVLWVPGPRGQCSWKIRFIES